MQPYFFALSIILLAGFLALRPKLVKKPVLHATNNFALFVLAALTAFTATNTFFPKAEDSYDAPITPEAISQTKNFPHNEMGEIEPPRSETPIVPPQKESKIPQIDVDRDKFPTPIVIPEDENQHRF